MGTSSAFRVLPVASPFRKKQCGKNIASAEGVTVEAVDEISPPQKSAVTDQRIVLDLGVRLAAEFPQGGEAHQPILFPSSTTPRHTHTGP